MTTAWWLTVLTLTAIGCLAAGVLVGRLLRQERRIHGRMVDFTMRPL